MIIHKQKAIHFLRVLCLMYINRTRKKERTNLKQNSQGFATEVAEVRHGGCWGSPRRSRGSAVFARGRRGLGEGGWGSREVAWGRRVHWARNFQI